MTTYTDFPLEPTTNSIIHSINPIWFNDDTDSVDGVQFLTVHIFNLPETETKLPYHCFNCSFSPSFSTNIKIHHHHHHHHHPSMCLVQLAYCRYCKHINDAVSSQLLRNNLQSVYNIFFSFNVHMVTKKEIHFFKVPHNKIIIL
jgi:hypothetical protein